MILVQLLLMEMFFGVTAKSKNNIVPCPSTLLPHDTYTAEFHLNGDWRNLNFAESHHATILQTPHQISVNNTNMYVGFFNLVDLQYVLS